MTAHRVRFVPQDYGWCWLCDCDAERGGYWNLDDCETDGLEHEATGESPTVEDWS